MSLLSP
jgi:phosphoribosylaminoimidazolecarboxamide formyltransferase/IMP cyclohydrolase